MHNFFILQQYVYYTTILNMFRAARCSSSGGQILSPQPLVSSPSANSRTVCRLRADWKSLYYDARSEKHQSNWNVLHGMENVNFIATKTDTKKLSHISVVNKKAAWCLQLLVACCSQQKFGFSLWQVPIRLSPEKVSLGKVSLRVIWLFSCPGIIPTVLYSLLSQTL